MHYLDISTATAKFDKLVTSCIKTNNIFNIATKNGNVVLINEKNYKSLIESLYLAKIPGMYKSITKGVNTPLEKCIKISK